MRVVVRGMLHFVLTMCVAGIFTRVGSACTTPFGCGSSCRRVALASRAWLIASWISYLCSRQGRAARRGISCWRYCQAACGTTTTKLKFGSAFRAMSTSACSSITRPFPSPTRDCTTRLGRGAKAVGVGIDEACCGAALLSVFHGVLRPPIELFVYRQNEKGLRANMDGAGSG